MGTSKLRYEDFTLDSYRACIRAAKNAGYTFSSYETFSRGEQFVLWRHDIDISVHRAAKLARIEREEGITATYFIWLHAYTYHFWERKITDLILQILGYGHKIGLHFDCEYYHNPNGDNIGDLIAEEARILAGVLQTKIQAVSLHNPSRQMLQNHKSERIGGLINAYSNYFFSECKYISDSNGLWRGDPLLDILRRGQYPRLQVLTHPVWWTEKAASPLQRVVQCIEGRARQNQSDYEELRNRILGHTSIES
jgi:hypothetical protein